MIVTEKSARQENIQSPEASKPRVLFANFPADGHFNPLTGIAVHLQSRGYDVRWYCAELYKTKIEKLGIPYIPFKHALNVNSENLEELFAERKDIKSQVKKINFDMANIFIKRGPEYYQDLKEVYLNFPFDIVIADCAFTGIPFITELMKIPVIGMGIVPLVESSKDIAPVGLGIEPMHNIFGTIRNRIMHFIADKFLFASTYSLMHRTMEEYGIDHKGLALFDILVQKSTYFLQSGTPEFEYKRSHVSSHISYVGSLLPYRKDSKGVSWHDERLTQYNKVILVTQGTVEKDITKLLEPTLEAYSDSPDTLVVATTGGNGTESLRKRFNRPNLIIEDFIPFDEVMPYADVYITNGGYGGVMLSIQNQLPMVVAGIHEGKNEINARVNYFKLGINLKTEKPKPAALKSAVQKIFADGQYKKNVVALSERLKEYNSGEMVEAAVLQAVKSI